MNFNYIFLGELIKESRHYDKKSPTIRIGYRDGYFYKMKENSDTEGTLVNRSDIKFIYVVQENKKVQLSIDEFISQYKKILN